MDLLRRSLCEDSADYKSLIANMSIVLNTLDCDSSGLIIMTQPGSIILKNMFDPTETVPGTPDGFWKGCFSDRNVYYYDKSCGQQSKAYLPSSGSDPCAIEAQIIASEFVPELISNTSIITITEVNSTNINYNIDGVDINVAFIAPFGYMIQFTFNGDRIFVNSGAGSVSIGNWVSGRCYTVINNTTYTDVFNYAYAADGGLTLGQNFIDVCPGETYNLTPLTLETDIANNYEPGACFGVEAYTFKVISDAYSCYLGSLTGTESLTDVQKVMLAFCGLLKERIGVDRILNKTMLTIGKCDL
jgi:hypothetical protein